MGNSLPASRAQSGGEIARRNKRSDFENLPSRNRLCVGERQNESLRPFRVRTRKAEAAVTKSPEDGPRHALLGLINPGLGRCNEATAEGKRAVELSPESKDAFDGPILAVSRARISVRCRDYPTALDLLERSLGIPAGITVAEL